MPNYRSRHRDGLIAATVRVLAGDSSGTGFFVAPGLVVTCAHVVPEPSGVTVEYGMRSYQAEVLVREPADAAAKNYSHPDVALLRVPLADHPCVPLDDGDPTDEQREVFGYGCPRLADGAFWEHMSMVTMGPRSEAGTGHVFIRTSRDQVQPGSSGAGVVDLGSGLLVGMVKLSRGQGERGAILVPTGTILAALAAAGYGDVLAANRAAVGGYDTVGEVRRRLGRLLKALESDLSRGIEPAQLALMLYALGDEPPEPVGVVDAALALIHVRLSTLAAALIELAGAVYSADQPIRLLGKAAALAVLANDQAWVDPRAAELLAAERDRPAPRIVQVPGSRGRTVALYATRATTRRNVTAVELTFGDADLDAATGLPVHLLTAVRCELLRPSVWVPDPSPDAVRLAWQENRAEALGNARQLMFILPDGADDDGLLAALQAEFPGCLFVLAARELRPQVRASGRVLELPGALPVGVERAAQERYEYLTRQLVEAASG